MQKAGTKIISLCVFGLLAIATPAGSQPADKPVAEGAGEATGGPRVLSVHNDYIAISVNAGVHDTGRFAVDTTGGDPNRTGDENLPLIYGRPQPWTSYTTVRVDGKDYVYGGSTQKRAGREGAYGTVLRFPEIAGGSAIDSAWLLGPLEVVQDLSIVKSSTTGLSDTAQIMYTVQNTDKKPHLVGLRIMLDTMLGGNDGAPFRFGERALVADTVIQPNQMPEFWQAFDSLSDPKVVAQGTLQGPGVTRPDKVYVSNWGALADGPWDFDFRPGRDFLRQGEFELDSAVALYWDPVPLQPGEKRVYVTWYGLGGITIAPGALSVGVSSPGEVYADAGAGKKSYLPVVAYIENTDEVEARNVVASISLPRGLTLASGQQLRRVVGNLAGHSSSQITWRVVATGEVTGLLHYQVQVEAANVELNNVERTVRVVAPPRISIKLAGSAPEKVAPATAATPAAPSLLATFTNTGGAPAYLLKVTVEPSTGLSLAELDRAERFLGTLEPGGSVEVLWRFSARGAQANASGASGGGGSTRPKGAPAFVVKAEGSNFQAVSAKGALEIQAFKPRIAVVPDKPAVAPGELVTVNVLASNLSGVVGVELGMKFDPAVLEVIGVSRGSLFVENEELAFWQMPHWNNQEGTVSGAVGRRTAPLDVDQEVVMSVHFRARAAGRSALGLKVVKITGPGQVLLPAVLATDGELLVK